MLHNKFFNYIFNLESRSFFLGLVITLSSSIAFFGWYHVTELEQIQDKTSETFNQDFMIAKFASLAKFNFAKIHHLMERISLSQDKEEIQKILSPLNEAQAEFADDISIIKERVPPDTELYYLVKTTQSDLLELIQIKERVIAQKLVSPQKKNTVWIDFEIKDKVIETLEDINDKISETSYLSKTAVQKKLDKFKLSYSIISVLFLIIFVLSLSFFNYLIIKPIHKLSHLFRDIANGSFDKHVETNKYFSDVRTLSMSFKILQSKFLEALLREEAANKALSSFLANMSHELRTPLNSIIGFSSMAIEKASETKLDDETINQLEKIRKSGEHLLSLINDVLDLSKINSGDFHIQEKPMDLVDSIKDGIALLEPKAKEQSLKIDFNSMGDQSVWIIGDNIRIKQIIINLVNNALKFTYKGGVYINLRIRDIEGDKYEIMIEVRDTGIGIPKEKQQQIFESFVQAENDTTHKYGGTGLGLSISKNLIERMNGRIWVESEVGIGSSFFFTIQAKKTTSSDSQVQIKQEMNNCALDVSWRLLVVEDDNDNYKICSYFLNRLGFNNIERADSALLAYEKSITGDFDLILMDMQLPDGNGPEITKKIKNTMQENFPLIAAFTANARESDREKCIKAGMIDFITKPISLNSLSESIIRIQRENFSNRLNKPQN